MSDKNIKVDWIARVEGEGGLDITISGGQVKDLKLRIFEPPRFFQAFLVGRSFDEVPDITARICGICPVSYLLAATEAMEDAMGIKVSQQTRDLRKLLGLSQFIQSHTLHIFMLAAPDFLGYESVIAMAPDHLPLVQMALRMKRLGNDLTTLIGGREVHPVNVKVNGFYKLPEMAHLRAIQERLKAAKEDALAAVKLVSSLQIPRLVQEEPEHMALSSPDEYALSARQLRSTAGLAVPLDRYPEIIEEFQVEHSTTLHSRIKGRGAFMVGPLPRVNVNFSQLSADARRAALESGLEWPNYNPFHSIVARAVEVVDAIDESVAIIDRLDLREENTSFQVKGGEGFGASEAPRGTLMHHYKVNNKGIVEFADIVAPTSRNLHRAEKDLWQLMPQVVAMAQDEATLLCEMAVRNYDPCISCSCHFLKLNIRREE